MASLLEVIASLTRSSNIWRGTAFNCDLDMGVGVGDEEVVVEEVVEEEEGELEEEELLDVMVDVTVVVDLLADVVEDV
ncbi:hypothetical protein HGRIS_006461 [Hohenbuehelia grisea]|uniref:Uncharacterized protein n=1 Tax=Hohenbuehelia grisea TaxID=104357 RepID=A0ABR3JZY6_9AGAR